MLSESPDPNLAEPSLPEHATGRVALIGLLVGAWVAFMLRPHGGLLGQASTVAVFTRAAGEGDLYGPLARASLTYLIAGALAGALMGAVIGYFAHPPLFRARTIVLALLGGILGWIIGYHLRPESPLGQLPFWVTLTRGAFLSQVDDWLRPLAKVSFNFTVGGASLGAGIGLFLGFLFSPKRVKVSEGHAILVAIASVAGLAELAYAVMNVSAMPVYLKYSMGYGETAVTAIGTAFLLCEGLMKGPFGILGDRIGRKWLIIAGPMVSVVTSLLTILVQPSQWYLFVLLRVLDGLGAAALWPSALAMIADVIPEEKRSQAMSLFNVTYLIGIALGPLIGGLSNDLTSFVTQTVPRIIVTRGPKALATHIHPPHIDPHQASFWVMSFLFLLTALVALWRIPNLRPHHEEHGDGAAEPGFSLASLTQSLKQIPETLVMAFITFLGIGLIMLIIKLFAMAEFGLNETAFGALLLVPALIIAVVSVPLGTLGDRIGKARAVRIGIGICALSMFAMLLIKHEAALVVGGSLTGVGFVIAFPAWMALISSSCEPKQRGAVMGAVGTAQGLGAMIGVPLGGFLYEHARLHIPGLPWINGHYAPFLGCAAMLVLAWVLSIFTIKEAPARCL